MVRKITAFVFVLVLIFGFAMTAQAESTENIYLNTALHDFNNTAVIELAKGYLDNIPQFVDYVLFRDSEESYTLVWGDAVYNEEEYRIEFTDYKGIWFYTNGWNNIEETERFGGSGFYLSNTGRIYSNLESYPTIIERGSQYEIIQTILLVVLLLSFVLHAIFRPR